MDLKKWLVWLTILALFLWAARAASDEGPRVQGNPYALKVADNLAYATRMARGWEDDAVLVAVEATEVREDGTVNIADPTRPDARIVYRFCSLRLLVTAQDAALAHRKVVLEQNTIRLLEDVSGKAILALPPQFKDMDAIWAVAAKKGAHGRATLTLTMDPPGAGHPCVWLFVAGPVTLRIDAVTGEVIQ